MNKFKKVIDIGYSEIKNLEFDFNKNLVLDLEGNSKDIENIFLEIFLRLKENNKDVLIKSSTTLNNIVSRIPCKYSETILSKPFSPKIIITIETSENHITLNSEVENSDDTEVTKISLNVKSSNHRELILLDKKSGVKFKYKKFIILDYIKPFSRI